MHNYSIKIQSYWIYGIGESISSAPHWKQKQKQKHARKNSDTVLYVLSGLQAQKYDINMVLNPEKLGSL